jgi:hypothetical protein
MLDRPPTDADRKRAAKREQWRQVVRRRRFRARCPAALRSSQGPLRPMIGAAPCARKVKRGHWYVDQAEAERQATGTIREKPE